MHHSPFAIRCALLLTAIAATLFPAAGVAADKTDVTTKVVAAVSDNKLTISATNETFGDTVPGVPKKLRVETASVTGKR